MKNPKTKSVSRRGFLATCGAAAASTTLPSPAFSAPSPAAGKAALVEGIRSWYAAELERLGEQLRPRFEAGELRAYRDEDHQRIPGTTGWGDECFTNGSPQWEIDRLVKAHFGLATWRVGNWIEGDRETAHMILAVSRFGDAVMECPADHAADHAVDAVTWDVIVMAQARGWYVPSPDDTEPPETGPSDGEVMRS